MPTPLARATTTVTHDRVWRPRHGGRALLCPLLCALLFALALISSGCEPTAGGYQGESPITFLSGDGNDGFARVLEPRAFDLPRDHGAHEEYQIEWWYFTGNLADAAQRRFGFELTFFRIGLDADAADRTERTSRWATDQLYMAHFAVTDVAGQRFHAFERLTRGALGLAGAEAAPLRVWNEDWRLDTGAGANRDPFPLRVVAADRRPGVGAVGIDLTLTALKPLVLQGDRGFSRKGPEPGNASYYLQYPRLDARGRLTLGEQSFAVRGLAWMDHEWSTSVLGPELAGWDWFALQLDDGRDLMVYQLRQRDGSATPASAGSIIDAAGAVTRLELADFDLEVTDRWRSPHTDAVYPAAWRLRIPAQSIDLRITPVMADQELRLSTAYWEGAVAVTTPAGVVGRGYVELVGYAGQE